MLDLSQWLQSLSSSVAYLWYAGDFVVGTSCIFRITNLEESLSYQDVVCDMSWSCSVNAQFAATNSQ